MHRGRLQSQGGPVNDSEPWAQPLALKYGKAIKLSNKLEKKANAKERKLRVDAFSDARRFMQRAHAAGGVEGISKTYMVKGDPHRRVDIEVRKGKAFV